MSNNLREYKSLELGDCYFARMSVTAFVGGDYGHSVQFTIDGKYCALAENQVRDLVATLQKRLSSVKKYRATSMDLDIHINPTKVGE